MQTLRKEMITNEEQRNYIEILKETIESNLFKNGFYSLIQNSKEYQNYNIQQGQEINDEKNILNVFIEFNKFKAESEKYKEELNKVKNLLDDTKNNKNILQKNYEDSNNQNIIQKDNLFQEKEKNKSLNLERDNAIIANENLNESNKNLNIENNKLKNQILEYQKINIQKDNELQENTKLTTDLKNELIIKILKKNVFYE